MFQQIRPDDGEMPRAPQSEEERRELYQSVKDQLENVQQAAIHLENSVVAETEHQEEQRAQEEAQRAEQAAQRAAQNIDECPICQEEISAEDATMRCDGRAGQHHYFHNHCLQAWIRQCQANGTGATCPICRGSVQMSGQRLDAFLRSDEARTLSAGERSYLQKTLENS